MSILRNRESNKRYSGPRRAARRHKMLTEDVNRRSELATKRDILDVKILIKSLENRILRFQRDQSLHERERRY